MKKQRCKRGLPLRREDGSFSLEAVIAMTLILMVTFLGIAYFTYLMPRQVVTQEVQALTQTAKIQGGLTQTDIQWFEERMAEKGFAKDEIIITVKGESKIKKDEPPMVRKDLTNVEPLDAPYVPGERLENSTNYSPRNSKEIMKIRVEIPSNNSFINAMSRFFKGGESSSLGNYVFNETIKSERW